MVWMWLIRVASWLVPGRERARWLFRWDCGLRDRWVLDRRGEFAGEGDLELSRYCRSAFADAFWARFDRDKLFRFVRGPAFALACGAAVLALLALLTGGFRYTRGLVDLALAPAPGRLPGMTYDPRAERLAAHFFPLALALATGIAILIIGHASLARRGWRYWSFLALKVGGVVTLLPLLWIEGGAALRAHLANEGARVLVGGLLFALLFVAGFGYALVWCLADQRRRCPVCLERLALPVTMGSWASVFEPPTTELLCDRGHGALCVDESGEEDRWTALDESWQELFEAKAGAVPRGNGS